MLLYITDDRQPTQLWRSFAALDAVMWPTGCYLAIAWELETVPLPVIVLLSCLLLMRLRRALFLSARYRPTTFAALHAAGFLVALFAVMKLFIK